MTQTSTKREVAQRDGLSLIVTGILLAPVGGFFFFAFSVLGVLAYPLLLGSLLTLGFGLAKRARLRRTSVAAAWLKALVYVVAITFLAFALLFRGPWFGFAG